MKRFWRLLASAVLALNFIFISTISASAKSAKEDPVYHFLRWETNVQLDKDGTAHITYDFDIDFAERSGHGPIIALPYRQKIPNDSKHYRDEPIKIISITSGTNAATDVQEKDKDGAKILKIGRRNIIYSTTQNYKISITQRGLISPKIQDPNDKNVKHDEFNFNAYSANAKSPIANFKASVRGPEKIEKSSCFYGTDYKTKCEFSTYGETAYYSQNTLSPGDGVQIVAGFPAGTFVGAEPTFSRRVTFLNAFSLSPVSLTGMVLVAIAAFGILAFKMRQLTRDEVYLGLTPGMIPINGTTGSVGFSKVKAPIAVQFSPPKDATPGELGTLLDKTADSIDVTSTIVDLAVRKYLTIIPSPTKEKELTSLKLNTTNLTKLKPFERSLIQSLFEHRMYPEATISLQELTDPSYHNLMSAARDNLYTQVVARKWFKKNPTISASKATVQGAAIALVGAAITALLGFFWLALIGVPIVITGILVILFRKKFSTRTAEGSAVLAQTKGFEHYLATAEADQIKFEENIDVFSKYLPYAMIFGLTTRWVAIFKELDRLGVYQVDTSWYGNYNFSMFDAYLFSSIMSDFSTSLNSAALSDMASSVTSGTFGSGGGSGFSGGGGFGGSSGGGW